MGRYTVLPTNAFDTLQLDAGIILTHFDIEAAARGELGFTDADILCATTGGVNPTCIATYSDFAEDVDNAPVNVKEFKHLDGWDSKLSTTGLGTSPELIRMQLGAADIVDGNKIVPRPDLEQTDFNDLWWVGDKANGGFLAIQIKNALSTGGFAIQTGKNSKGTLPLEITGHTSLATQKEVPMVFYSIDGETAQYVQVTPTGTENPSEEGWYEIVGGIYVLTADTEVDASKTYYERVSPNTGA